MYHVLQFFHLSLTVFPTHPEPQILGKLLQVRQNKDPN